MCVCMHVDCVYVYAGELDRCVCEHTFMFVRVWNVCVEKEKTLHLRTMSKRVWSSSLGIGVL